MTSIDPSIRPAHADDADALASIYLTSRLRAPMPAPVHTDEAIRFWIAGKLQSADQTWVAEVGGEAVGYARVAGAWLDDLYVLPSSGRAGVGTALLDVVKSACPDGFCLWVFETNTPARAFYARHGLVELEHTDGLANQERAPDIRMAWPGKEPLTFLRRLVDEVDDDLARLIDTRSRLTLTIQRFKSGAGPPGRDAAREREIVARMAELAPGLGVDRMRRIVDTIITESLDAAD